MDWITDGLDCWSGLIDWITGLNLFMLHDLHPIKCHKFGYSKHISSSHCMLGNVHECTMHKLHGRMCIINSWCTRSEFKAPSDYSEHAKSIKNTDKGLFTTKNKCTDGVSWRTLVSNAILVSGFRLLCQLAYQAAPSVVVYLYP